MTPLNVEAPPNKLLELFAKVLILFAFWVFFFWGGSFLLLIFIIYIYISTNFENLIDRLHVLITSLMLTKF